MEIESTMNPDPATEHMPSRGLQASLLLVAAIFLIVGSMGAVWSGYVDLAHHYALVARISEYWALPTGSDPTLGEMNFYPPTSHVLAAIAGTLFDSPMIGLQLVTLASIIVLWASLIQMLMSPPRRLAVQSLAIFVGLMVVNRVWLRFEIHGREVASSFFYAQMVGQALLALTLSMALALDRRSVPAETRFAILIALMYFCAGIHLLPALQLLGFLLLVIFLEFATGLGPERNRNLRNGLVSAAFAAVAIALLVSHPSFSAMREISKNNGAFLPRHFGSVAAIAAYAALIAIASATVVFGWFKAGRAPSAPQWLLLKYVGLYGLAVSGLCLLQFAALKFGQGSDYAVKKHIFSLNTIVLLELALIPLLVAAFKAGRSPPAAQGQKGFVFAYLLLPLLTVLAFYAIAPRKKAADTVEIVKLERLLQRHRDALVSFAPDKFVYLMPGPKVSPVLAYMMTIAILKSPRGQGSDSNSLNILRGEQLSEWPLVGTVLASAPPEVAGLERCRRSFPELPFAVLDGQCLGRAMAGTSSVIRLSSGGDVSSCSLKGFSAAETLFRWTEQKQASIECRTPEVDGRPANSVTISAGAFLNRVPFQRAILTLNGGPATELRFDESTPARSITLALPATGASTTRIDISLPDAISPKDVGVSADPRQLGLSISKIEFK